MNDTRVQVHRTIGHEKSGPLIQMLNVANRTQLNIFNCHLSRKKSGIPLVTRGYLAVYHCCANLRYN